MNTANKDLAQYFKNVKKRLNFPLKQKEQLIKGIENDLQEYEAEHPNCTYDEIVERYGKPEALAENCMSEWGPHVIQRMKKRNRIKMILIGVFIACLLCVLISVLLAQPVRVTETIIQYQ